ncbi:heat shock 70 kDa protein 12A-like protein [Lates japonicus]|uniref:Heat shock 70 kDa protein 12A-like protein n=1 Tax=Lates japonicus TaxID=270547 RepID=A0AAD3RGW7_LATJO|nr:heat shock 70 kDa protein 12A-like protein [Lates japonicus]
MGDSYVIAIDFGTAYSGYAFSMTPRGEEIDPFLKRWGKELGLDTPKTPTCILFNEEEEFLKFGYEAKTEYLNMRGKARKHYFFEAFKMALYGKTLNKDMTIKAANGKSMKALKVFTEALRYLKEDALKTIAANTAGTKFIASDFTWVLTVPTIWDPSAKQFMREAATQAGIVTKGTEDRLVIALEPEAASVWCKKLPAEGFISQNHGGDSLEHSPGTQYIVVDCGGGTIDITVHEVLDGGALKALHKASGNDLGGQTVDKKYKEFLREIFCDGLWDEYEKVYCSSSPDSPAFQ